MYVLEGPNGPVALMPSELEFYSVEDEIFEADLELRRYAAKQAVGSKLLTRIVQLEAPFFPCWSKNKHLS